MIKKTLTINISGELGSGKTTFARAIKKLCDEFGIESSITDFDCDFENKNLLLDNLTKTSIVQIKTTRTKRT